LGERRKKGKVIGRTIPLPTRILLHLSHPSCGGGSPCPHLLPLVLSGRFMAASTTAASSTSPARGGSRRRQINRRGLTARAMAAGVALEGRAMSPYRPSRRPGCAATQLSPPTDRRPKRRQFGLRYVIPIFLVVFSPSKYRYMPHADSL
jgi:hypothetical protein